MRLAGLLRAGADPNSSEVDGLTPLTVAMATGEPSLVERLLAAGADPSPALAATAWEDSRVTLIERLLAAGAEPDRPNAHGFTALYNASIAGNTAIVRALLKAGADPNRQGDGQSADTPLCGAATWGHRACVQALLDAGADPNRPDGDGTVPLRVAVEEMDGEMVASLLAAGADPNHGALLVLAAECGSLGIVQALLAHGADPRNTNDHGRTALDAARAKVDLDLERCLADQLPGDGPVEITREPRAEGTHHIEVRRTSSDESTIDLAAAENGHSQIVALLLAH